jgi:hypothetical protein
VTRPGWTVVCLSLHASASAGCLLFSDPINSAPTVSIKCPQPGLAAGDDVTCPKDPTPELFRGSNAFEAVAFDKNQAAETLSFEWWYADKNCDLVFQGLSQRGPKIGLAGFPYQNTELDDGCVGVVVTDSQGAFASASQLFTVVDRAPTADIKIASASGVTLPPPGQPLALPLFAKATLTGKDSKDPDEDKQLDYLWSVYSGDLQIAMPGCPDPSKDTYLCTFASATPGTFRVQLVVADNWFKGTPVEQVIEVADDQLPKIVVESVRPAPPLPPEDVPLQLLASVDNTFAIARVEDDGDPYPSDDPLFPYPKPPAGFIWFYKTSSDLSFKRLIGETGPSFTIKANTFLPQQSIQVRVEYRDRVTACQPNVPGCNAVFDSCSKLGTICYAPGVRPQWVTWAVDFR